MAVASTSTIRHFFVSAVTAFASRPQGVRGPLRGKDFMLDDQTSGADRDGQ
jgi:hypothetical protein